MAIHPSFDDLRVTRFALALMPFELFLQIGLSVNGLRQGAQRHFENLVAIVAYSEAWSSTQPLNDLKTTRCHNAVASPKFWPLPSIQRHMITSITKVTL
jgi:hypothetical protein